MRARNNNGFNMDCAQTIASPAVLVVEDNWQIARSIRHWLEEADLTVMGPAPSIEHAQQCLKKETPEVAVVDLNLRGELSYPLIAELEAKNVQVIVITGYAAPARDLRKDAFVLEKPISREALIEAVRERTTIQ